MTRGSWGSTPPGDPECGFTIGRAPTINAFCAAIKGAQLYLPNEDCTELVESNDWAWFLGVYWFGRQPRIPQ